MDGSKDAGVAPAVISVVCLDKMHRSDGYELLLTGERVLAARVAQAGLVNRVVPAAELRAATQEMALRIANNAPLSVRASKALVYASASLGWTEGLAEGDRLFEPVYKSQDAQEGPRAFREKRPPRWTGR